MSQLIELELDMLDQVEERAFIEWMIESLEREQLAALLLAINIKLPGTAIEKLHQGFIRNKLLQSSARKKLKRKAILPPFPFMVKVKNEQLTKEELIALAQENHCSESQIALILYLQNYDEAALIYYDHREQQILEEKEIGNKEDAAQQVTEKLPPKIGKRLQQRITTLTKEKEELNKQVAALKEELKERNRTSQNELNQLKQEIAEATVETTRLTVENEQFQIALTEAKKQEQKHVEVSTLKAIPTKSLKVAFIGNPLNVSIVSMDNIQVDIYETDTIEDFINTWTAYDRIFYLSYTFDEVTYGNVVPENIREKIISVENFIKLKRMMGEL